MDVIFTVFMPFSDSLHENARRFPKKNAADLFTERYFCSAKRPDQSFAEGFLKRISGLSPLALRFGLANPVRTAIIQCIG
jgi:hypothetical protein